MRRYRCERWRRVCALPLLLVLTACSDDTLYSGLDEHQANEMVALLHGSGLPASKVSAADRQFAVTTSREHFARSVAVLQTHGLPRASFDTLGSVFAKEGFVSSPLEERARLNHALSQEIAHTITSIDGVVMARVHLAVPEQDDLRDIRRPASASVFVKHRADHDLSADLAQIKALVVNGVESLPYENVTLALFAADDRALQTMSLPVGATAADSPTALTVLQGRLPEMRLTLISGALVLCLLMMSIVGWWQRRARRSASSAGAGS